MDPERTSENAEKLGEKRSRILFFDVLRIIFIAFIIYGHYQFPFFSGINKILYIDGYLPYDIYPLGLTGLAVFGMIFISGAVLEYNYKKIERFSDYKKFLFKRFIRLYPAYWMSLLLAIMIPPWVFPNGFFGIFMEFTGFFFLLGKGAGYLNIMGWFIGTIFCLYLLFPFLSRIVEKYRLWSLFIFMMMSYLSRFLLFAYDPNSSLDLMYRWLPFTNVFEFCLGIYLIQNTFYLKNVNKYPFIQRLSEFSFYAFLFHIVVISVFVHDVSTNGPMINFILGNLAKLTQDYVLSYTLWYAIIMAAVVLVSWCAMLIDGKLQKVILRDERVQQFLKE
jgi:peptidoglycan/LPS O-acetylase OafA/YrhL